MYNYMIYEKELIIKIIFINIFIITRQQIIRQYILQKISGINIGNNKKKKKILNRTKNFYFYFSYN